MATEADLIQKFKDLNIPVGADFEELIHTAFAGANLADLVNNYDSRITTVENDLSTAKDSIQSNTNQLATKADDSKVVHSTVTQLNSTDMNTVKIAGFYQLISGTNGMPSADAYSIYQVISYGWANGVQLAYGTNNAILGMRSWSGGKNFTSWVQFADDSKVAHLSGANNFDTVPTVNNNPLLLASSLPSDLARTTKDANFTGKLQKSGIDVATKSDVTTAVNTATENMADTTKATNFTAGLQSGGVDVATAADLKSVEASAWRRLDFGSDANLGGAVVSSYIIYQIHDDEKYLSFFYLGVGQSENKDFSDNTTLMDLSSIVKGISSIDFSVTQAEINGNDSQPAGFKISGTKIITSTSSHRIYISAKSTVSLYPLNHNDRRIYYTELV